MGLAALSLIVVALALSRTRLGKATRAVSDNPDLAEATGIDVDKVTMSVWVAGTALAALGGIFLGAVVNVDFLMGFNLLLLMFAAVILGGLGQAYGAMVGGLIIGVATEIPTVWFQPEIKSVFALAVLIGVLLIRPQGVLGSKARVG
jgi:neutral amino acid transport system permease protein